MSEVRLSKYDNRYNWHALDVLIDILKAAELPLTTRQILHRFRVDYGLRYGYKSINAMVCMARQNGTAIDRWYDRPTRAYRYEMRYPTC